jgi:nicotinate-nucleotide adenylyltransferase
MDGARGSAVAEGEAGVASAAADPAGAASAAAPAATAATPVPASTRRSVGILGGTFDPVHIGHLAVGEEAREALGLDEVLFVPAGLPPHKQDRVITPAHHRVAMLELAIRDNDRFSLSRVEIDRAGPSWTVDTVAALVADAERAGTAIDVTLILSAESWAGFAGWRSPERLLSLCRIAVVPRAGFDVSPPRATPAAAGVEPNGPASRQAVQFLDGPRLRVSSSEIRARLAAGRSVRYLVPDAVIRYIGDHGLYAAGEPGDPGAAT